MKYLLFTWQILQNLVGLCYWLISQGKHTQTIGDVWVIETDSKNGSVSLGNFVFVTKYAYSQEYTLQHELGHTIQSKYLGPLYLLVIGLPSILWVLARKVSYTLRKKDYYWFYTERWANKLAGI